MGYPYPNGYGAYLSGAYPPVSAPAAPQFPATYPASVQQQQSAPQPMTPPTVHADIIQAKSVEEVQGFPVNAGSVVMFQLGGGEAFITKEVTADGQINIDIYPKQPKKPPAPPIDPAQFVTWDALGDALDKWAAGRETGKGKRKRQDEAEAAQES